MPTTTLTLDEIRSANTQAGRKIESLSIAWTTLEAAVGVIAGVLAASVALIGFGVDSAIEVASSVVLLWRLSDHPHAEEREEIAHRLVGVGFLALATYICFDALRDLITHEPPRVSYFGIAYAAACIVVMPLLARAKRRVAARLDSDALHADSHQSDICAYLSVILLVGLALNALFGWWWADPVAALCMLPIIIKEGFAGLRGESCRHHHDA
jgi:divalent metal cation (Fe/Co/Zn/Cd) transporter